jgi:hypothetical protein
MKNISAFFFLMYFPFVLFSQPKETESLRKKFDNAEAFFVSELYMRALPVYQEILAAEPDNYNISFKIGVCYLNSPSEKS